MKFLDTCFLIDILRKHEPAKKLLYQLDLEGPHMTNTIILYEFLVGAHGAKDPEKELKARQNLISKIIIVPFDKKSAEQSAVIENELRKAGKLIGTADILVAGTMKAYGINTIITTNDAHFKHIKGINVQKY